jgi:hypothetical protein
MEVDYSPGLSQELTFMVSGYDGDVEVEVYGDLAVPGSVVLSESRFSLSGEGMHPVKVSFVMADLSGLPGSHTLKVSATEVAADEYGVSADMSARARIVGRAETFIPYPDKYAQMLFVFDSRVQAGKKMYFRSELSNLGGVLIDKCIGYVKVFGPDGSDISILPLTPVSDVAPGSKAVLRGEWGALDARPGVYFVQCFVEYDGVKLESPRYSFLVGDVYLDISGISPTTVASGDVSKITVSVSSVWNKEISFSADIFMVSADGSLRKLASSAPAMVQPWSGGSVDLFVETEGIAPGNYSAKVVLYYESKESFREFTLEVIPALPDVAQVVESPVELEESSIYVLLGAISVVLMFVVLALTFVLMKLYRDGGKVEKRLKDDDIAVPEFKRKDLSVYGADDRKGFRHGKR